MTMKVSLGGLNHKAGQKLRSEMDKASNTNVETMEEYTNLIRLVRQSFSKNHHKPSNTS